VEGKVVEKATGRPVGGIRLTTGPGLSSMPGSTATSQPDGTFVLAGLDARQHEIFLETPGEPVMEWAALPVQVETVAGQTLRGVQVEVIRGGVLEIEVAEMGSGVPIAGCIARIPYEKGFARLMISDSHGKASLRVVPGPYEVQLYPVPGYVVQDSQQSDVEIQEGATCRLPFQLVVQPRPKPKAMGYVWGTVFDPDGRPAKGVKLHLLPGGGDTVSDSQGRFKTEWQIADSEQRPSCLMARDERRNLAAAVDVDVQTGQVDVRLQQGVTLTGRVADPEGRPLVEADVRVTSYGPEWVLSWHVQAGSDGRYRISGLPQGLRYETSVIRYVFGEATKTVSPEEGGAGPRDVRDPARSGP